MKLVCLYCLHSFPENAMAYGNLYDIQNVALKLEELRGRGFRIFKLPEWERSRSEIVYASKR